MALDKLVDSSQLDTDLTSVANAIRTKGGTSASLSFPADFVSAINAISTGGSFKYKTGTFTVPSDTANKITVPHSLGETPDVIVVWTNDYDGGSGLPISSNTNFGFIWLRGITTLLQGLSSSTTSDKEIVTNLHIPNGKTYISFSAPTSGSYTPDLPTSTNFYTPKIGNANYWRANVSYKYFVANKWW